MRIFQVDSFADRPFSGNPAGVCLLETPVPDAWMQSVAREMNLSETAFVQLKDREPSGEFGLRWFTPKAEVELCGHGTLATAHILWETGVLRQEDAAVFRTLSGVLVATCNGPEIELDFPTRIPVEADPPEDLTGALGVVPVSIARAEDDYYLVELESEEAVRAASPDFGRLEAVEARGVAITSLSMSDRHDFVSRFFAPAVGVNEDPVTGSAHCALGPFWGERLGKTELVGYQASARGGTVRVRLEGERVRLGGRAVTVLSGQLNACDSAPASG
jgi:PhzF family phenazine biosynthesis protein